MAAHLWLQSSGPVAANRWSGRTVGLHREELWVLTWLWRGSVLAVAAYTWVTLGFVGSAAAWKQHCQSLPETRLMGVLPAPELYLCSQARSSPCSEVQACD